MVASVLPFFAVLSNPDAVSDIPFLAKFRDFFGLDSGYSLLVAVGIGSLVIILSASAVQVWKLIVLERFAVQQAYNISRRVLKIFAVTQPRPAACFQSLPAIR